MKDDPNVFSRANFKSNAKGALKRFYGKGLWVTVLCALITAPLVIAFLLFRFPNPVSDALSLWATQTFGFDGRIATGIVREILNTVVPLVAILLFAPLEVGIARFYLECREKGKAKISTVFKGLAKNYWRNVLAMLVRNALFVMSFFILPSFPWFYCRYSLLPYILAENPNIGPVAALRESAQMTHGYKWDIFKLDFSFIGWRILALLTGGIGFIFLRPFVCASFAEAYSFIRQREIRYDHITEADYPGFADGESLGAVYFEKAPTAEEARAAIAAESEATEAEDEEYEPILIMPEDE